MKKIIFTFIFLILPISIYAESREYRIGYGNRYKSYDVLFKDDVLGTVGMPGVFIHDIVISAKLPDITKNIDEFFISIALSGEPIQLGGTGGWTFSNNSQVLVNSFSVTSLLFGAKKILYKDYYATFSSGIISLNDIDSDSGYRGYEINLGLGKQVNISETVRLDISFEYCYTFLKDATIAGYSGELIDPISSSDTCVSIIGNYKL